MQSFPMHYFTGPHELWGFCLEHVNGKIKNLIMQASTGIVTLAVNGIMKGLLNKLQKLIRAKTICEEE